MNTSNAVPVSIGFHTTSLMLMCGNCNTGCPSPRALSNHLGNVHKICTGTGILKCVNEVASAAKRFAETMDAEDLSELYMSAPRLSPANNHEVFPLHPLAGLPVRDGVQCSACFKHHSTVRTLPSHLEKVHGYSQENARMETARLSSRHMVKVQSLFSGNKRKFFPVTTGPAVGEILLTATIPVSTTHHNETAGESKAEPKAAHGAEPAAEHPKVSEAKATLEKVVSSEQTTTGVAVAASVKSLFHALSKDGQEMSDGLDGQNGVGNALKNSFTSVTHFDDALELLALSPYDALSIMEPALHLQENTVLDRQDVVNAVVPYFSRLGSMLPNTSSRVLRSVNLRDENRQFQRTTVQTEKRYAVHVAQLLMFAYKSASMPFGSGINLSPVLALFENWEHGTWEGVSGCAKTLSDAFIARLHAALRCLLLATIDQTESLSMLVVRNFIVCACIVPESPSYQSAERPPYRYADAEDASPILAALQYSVGAVAVQDVWYIRHRFREESQKSLRAAETEKLFAAVSSEENSAAVFVRNTLNIAMGILKKEESRPNFDHCAVHQHCGVVNYSHLSMVTLGTLVTAQHTAFDDVFHEELLLGAALPAKFNSAISSLRDQPSNRSPGFSFMSLPGHQLDWVQENTEFVLNAIQNPGPEKLHKTPCILSKDVAASPDVVAVNGIAMRRSGVEKFLRSCERLQEYLLVSMHFSSGSPARATEIRALRLHNDVHSIRNVFISQDGEVVLNPTYTKARSLCGFTRAVYRFPDKGTAIRLLQYYTFIRPLECAMVESLYGKEAMNKQWTFMFARKGTQLSAQQIRNIVAKALRSVGVSIGLADYRQFSSGMVPVVCKRKLQVFASDVMDDFISVGHEQASHTRNMAERKYARTSALLPYCSGSDLTKAKQFSYEWHSLMRLQSSIRDEVAEALFQRNQKRPDGEIVLRENPEPSPSARLSMTGKAPSTVICSAALPMPSSTPPSLFSQVFLENQARPGSVPAAVNLHVGRLDQYDHLVMPLTEHLKKATGSRSAEFKSQTQFSVTAFIAWQRFNALVLMPTGAGKTMCVLLPAVIEKELNKSTIIIVPLRALVKQYLATASGFGLDGCSDFGEPGTDAFAHLYIFSAEQVHKPAFRELVSRLRAKQRLSRVVIDEAHLTVLWQSFRMALQFIRTGLSVIPQEIPRILLSATVPPHQRANLLGKHGLNDATVFSMPTIRRNLGFEVFIFQTASEGNGGVEKERLRSPGGRFLTASKSLLFHSIELLIKRLLEEVERMQDGSSPCQLYRVMVYALTRREVVSVKDEVQTRLDEVFSSNSVATQTLFYHGGLPYDEREETQEKWIAPESGADGVAIRVMVCTSAFGTGVDVSNVRLTLHIGGARSLVEFVQECGRAGRDGLTATCLTTYDVRYEVTVTHDQDNDKSETEKMLSIQHRNEMVTWILSSSTCRKNRLYSYIDGGVAGVCRFDTKTVWCDVCRTGCDGYKTESDLQSSPTRTIPWNEVGSTPPGQMTESDARQSRKRKMKSPLHGVATSKRVAYDPAQAPLQAEDAQPGSFSSTATREQDTAIGVLYSQGSSGMRATNASPTAVPIPKPMGVEAQLQNTSGSTDAWTENPTKLKPHSASVPRQGPAAAVTLEPCPWIEEASGEELIEATHQLHNLAQEACLMCLAATGTTQKHSKPTSCSWIRRRCLRCHSTSHSVKECGKDTKIVGSCFGCGMNYCKNIRIHTSGFFMGGRCNLQVIVSICWALWDRGSLRDAIAQNFFTDDIARKYYVLCRKPSRAAMHAIFTDALKESPDAVPMPMRLALSWAIGMNIVEIQE